MTDEIDNVLPNEEEVEEIEEEVEEIIFNENFIRDCAADKRVIRFISKYFNNRLNRKSAIKLITKILDRQTNIHIKDLTSKWKGLLQYNKGKFEKNKKIKNDELKHLRMTLNGFLLEIGKEVQEYDEKQHTFKIEKTNGEKFFVLDKTALYKKVRNLTCDEGGDVLFKYDFDTPDIKLSYPVNDDLLQRCNIQILSDGVKFDYQIEDYFNCPQCGTITKKKVYETASTNHRIGCEGTYHYIAPATGDSKAKICGKVLSPDNEIGITKDAFYYDVAFEATDGTRRIASAISFKECTPGFYEGVIFKIKNPNKTEICQIMDTKEILNNKIELPEKVEGENYLITLQKSFDNFIKNNTKMEIYGLYPIKIAMIIQTLINILGFSLISNIQIVGDASTGKSTVLKYYSFLLNNQYNLSSNGLSISIPALRGTKVAITLMGREQKIITQGYLGTYKSIHIDEAAENDILIQNLKTFLLEDNYGYDKAGATGIFHKRTAHINISQNINNMHLSIYRSLIRKKYKDENIEIEGEQKLPWDENWDLHLPLNDYENSYLFKAIKDVRTDFYMKQRWWIDGVDYALHQRFPFNYYLVNKKQNEKLREIIKGNVSRGIISDNLELIKALKTEDIYNFFKSLNKYLECKYDIVAFNEVDRILKDYGIVSDSRTDTFFYNIVKISRIINQRFKYTEEDFHILKFIIESIDKKLDVSDTCSYEINGPPDLGIVEARDNKIEDSIKEVDDTGVEFGLPDDFM